MITILNRVDGRDMPLALPYFVANPQAPHSTYFAKLPLLPGTSLRDIDKIKFAYTGGGRQIGDTGDTWNIKTLKLSYDLRDGGRPVRGVLMHKRGAPARKLDRGDTWTVYTER